MNVHLSVTYSCCANVLMYNGNSTKLVHCHNYN